MLKLKRSPPQDLSMSEVVYVIRMFYLEYSETQKHADGDCQDDPQRRSFPVHPCDFLPTPLYCLEDKLWSCGPSNLLMNQKRT